MSQFRYPQGTRPQKISGIRDRHAHRGQSLEKDINDSNAYYKELDIALIYKKPTPIQVVSVDYPMRNKAKITEAYYKIPSTTDYNGIYRGKYIDFEAKETRNKTSFPIRMIHPHQIEHLRKVIQHGGIGFFLIRFSSHQQTFMVDASLLIQKIDSLDRQSIPYNWFVENGIPITEGLYPRLPYLKAINSYYFKEDISHAKQDQ